MKRAICPKHIHFVRNNKKAMLSSENCSVCKRESTIGPLRLSNLFKRLAEDLEDSYENPNYDPHGFCIQDSSEKAMKAYFKLIHPAYLKPLLESLQTIVKERSDAK